MKVTPLTTKSFQTAWNMGNHGTHPKRSTWNENLFVKFHFKHDRRPYGTTLDLFLTSQKVEEPKKRGLSPSQKPEHCSDSREGPSPLLFFINVLQDLSHKRKLSCVSSLNQRGGVLLSSRGAPLPFPSQISKIPLIK